MAATSALPPPLSEWLVRPAVIVPVRLPDVLFPAGSSPLNNCGKRILLEQLRASYQRDPGGMIVLVGHSSCDEMDPIWRESVP